MADTKSSINWTQIILGILPLAIAIFGIIFGITKNNQANQAEKDKINAQNQIAAMSKIRQEDLDTWSRLSQQRTDVENELKQQNQDLYNLVHQQNEKIESMSTIVASIHPVHMVVNNPTETIIHDNTGERTRVDFDQTHENYLRVHGFTLTNPAQADLTIEFTQPLRLTTVVTQNPDGSWRSYVSAHNWPDLQIDNIDVVVNPLVASHERQWYQNILIGTSLNLTTEINGFNGLLYVMYDFGNFAIGPDIGVFANPKGSDVFFGLTAELRPF